MKKILSLIIALCMLVPLACCGKGNQTVSESRTKYSNIDPTLFENLRDYLDFDRLYLVEQSDSRTISREEAFYLVYNIARNTWERAKEYDTVTEDSIHRSYLKAQVALKPYLKEFSDAELLQDISKKELAILLAKIAEKDYQLLEETTTLDPNLVENADNDDIKYLNSAVNYGLIENNKEDLNATSITQTEFEKILIQFAIDFAPFAGGNNKLKGNERLHIITDPAFLPSNADWYPFVLNNAPKEVYECSGSYDSIMYNYEDGKLDDSEQGPIYLSKVQRWRLEQSYEDIKNFFEAALNVDYRTVTPEYLLSSMNDYVSEFEQDSESLLDDYDKCSRYVQYLKKHEIIISAKVTPLFPCTYTTSPYWSYLKCKVELNIVSSNIKNPELCIDLNYLLGTENDSTRYIETKICTSAESSVFRAKAKLKVVDPSDTDL